MPFTRYTAAALLSLALLPACLENAAVTGGFAQPESAHFHATHDTWFVSNIAGDSGARDGEGWLSRLDAHGEVLEERWLDGLHSPAGVSSTTEALVVADIDTLHVINIEDKHVRDIAIAGAGFLNDVFVDPAGVAWVSDTATDTIYRVDLDSEVVSVAVRTPELHGPNGLLLAHGFLYVGSIGAMTDLFDEAPLFRIPLARLEHEPLDHVNAFAVGELRGKYDGLALIDGAVWLSDFRGTLFKLVEHDERGGPMLVEQLSVHHAGALSAADFGLDPSRRRLMVPDLLGGNVTRVQLP